MVINDVLSVFYFPLFYFAFMQAPNLLSSTSAFFSLNAALTILLLVCALVMPIVWTVMWKVKSRD
jgi:hypothetical protein